MGTLDSLLGLVRVREFARDAVEAELSLPMARLWKRCADHLHEAERHGSKVGFVSCKKMQ